MAAPTAGLHLTDACSTRCRAAGAEVAAVELVVGLGTFRPITTDRVEDHPMHAERYECPADDARAVRGPPTRVVAVGTTVVRALESAAAQRCADGPDRAVHPRRLSSSRLVDRLLTNFHVPRSSLLALVDAFVGPAVATALRHGAAARATASSRFGDAMLLDRRWGRAA